LYLAFIRSVVQYTKSIFVFLMLCVGQFAGAQTDIVHRFSAKLDNETVFIGVIIKAGSTCQGISIERSLDSLQFEEVGKIEGTCGSSFTDVPYTFTDLSPAQNAANYYRLKFGENGYSAIEKVLFVRLIGGAKVIPNPVGAQTQIYFANPDRKNATFNLFDIRGQLVMTITDIKQDNFEVNTSNLASDVYTFSLRGEGINKISGKLVKH